MILAVCPNPAIDRVYFVDDFKMNEVRRPKSVSVSAGGKGLNVARVADCLGAKVCVTGFLGGYSGKFILDELNKLNIDNSFLFTDNETRTCINITDKYGNSGEILESGDLLSAFDEENFIVKYKELAVDADVITISGSMPKGLSDEFYSKMIDFANINCKRIIVDTSGSTLKKAIESKPYMIKPNRQELKDLFGCSADSFDNIKKALKDLYNSGVKVPLCTLGSQGAILLFEDKYYHFITPEIKVVNSVGSGDSTVAAIAVALSENKNVIDSVKYGMAAGLTNALYEQTGLVDKNTVDRYYLKIKTEII